MNFKHPYFILFLLISAIFTSCTRYKDLVLLQGVDNIDTSGFGAIPPEYKIQKRDILFIRIFSMDQEITQVINATNALASSQFTNDASLFIYGYDVNDSGFVDIPILGKINVAGESLEEAKNLISARTEDYLKDATVVVKLISFKYSVLGEVKEPGIYQNYNNQLTVLEAISNAGDFSPYGNRRKILVIRAGIDGMKTFRIDLTNPEILNSEGFFLLPNDIVYAEPVKSYNFRVNIPIITLFFSGISSLILILNYID